MKSRSTRVFAGALFVLCCGFVLQRGGLAAESTAASITGVIRDAANVVDGATVRITNLQDNTTQNVRSGANGEYRFEGLPAGTYAIVAIKPGMSFSLALTHVLGPGERFRADFNTGAADASSMTGIEQKLDAMEKRIEQLEAELAAKSGADQIAALPVRQQHGPLLASASQTPNLPALSGPLAVAGASAAPDAPTTTVAPPAPAIPKALQSPDPGPAVDNFTPFAYADFTWLNGTSRNKDTVLDTQYFTPEVRFDTNYMEDFNQPMDHTIVGSTESFRSGEVQIEQASVGGDFHWDNVRGRILFMQGLFSTTTPRNDASSATSSAPGDTGGVGQWDLQDAYKYVSEAYGGYHFNVQHGLNVDAGIFVSYIGLFSYYNFDNWTYQPSYVSSNTPWFFNGLRAQWYPTNKLKIEPWFINGWQSYAKYNGHPGLGGQLLWMPKEWFKLVANQYGFGQDNLGLPHTERIHTDDSIEIRFYNKPNDTGLSKIAMSLTTDAGCQYGGGIRCLGAPSDNKDSFVGWMLYNRYWFHKDLLAVTLGGGDMSNFGRYLTLLPPIDGAWAASGTPYFTENPGQAAHMWDSTVTLQYMPKEYVTWWLEAGYRHSDVPYFAGRGGVTPPGGDNGYPQYYTCMSGATAGTADLSAAQAACGSAGVWFPDLVRHETKLSAGVLVKF